MSEPYAPNSIEDWLSEIGLPQYTELFRSNDITLEVLATLTDADLKDCGIESFGHRKLIIHRIRQLQSPATPMPTNPPSPTMPLDPPTPAPGEHDLITAAVEPIASVPEAKLPPETNRVPSAAEPVREARQKVQAAAVESESAPRRIWWKRIFASNVLMISILVHVLFGIGATYLIVQSIEAKRKLTFQGGPTSPNPSTRALEHQINMTRRQQTMSAPAQAKRITTTGLAKITLPDMPSLPAADNVTPERMAGMGGIGMGFGMSGGGGGGGGGGRGVTLFGFTGKRANALEGTFYDIKRDEDNQPTSLMGKGNSEVGAAAYTKFLRRFVENDFRPSDDIRHFTSRIKLYSSFFFFYQLLGIEAGKEFQAPECGDGLWIAHYVGTMAAPEDGTYRFVGFADNVMLVRANNQFVLEAGCGSPPPSWTGKKSPVVWAAPTAICPRGLPMQASDWFEMRKGETIPVEVVVGDEGGLYEAELFIQKENAVYAKYDNGSPILPLFSVAPFSSGELEELKKHLPDEALKGPFFQARGGAGGMLGR